MRIRLLMMVSAAVLLLLGGLWLSIPGPSAAAQGTVTPAPPSAALDGPLVFIASPDSSWHSPRSAQWDIYILHPGAPEPQRLTFTEASEDQPVLSPDGSQIAFVRLEEHHYNLYVMDTDGSNQRVLTTLPDTDNLYPAWSPDGSRILFTSTRTPEGWYAIFEVDPAGGSTPQRFAPPEGWGALPVWSPDGSRVAFQYRPESGAGLGVVGADGGNFEFTVEQSPRLDGGLVWSQDSQQVAFSAHPGGQMSELFVLTVEGMTVRRVTTAPSNAVWSFDWSPDGSLFAFTGQDWDDNLQTHLILVNADGSDLHRLIDARGREVAPRFSADGSRLFFWTDADNRLEHYDLYVVDVAGGTPQRITFLEGAQPSTDVFSP